MISEERGHNGQPLTVLDSQELWQYREVFLAALSGTAGLTANEMPDPALWAATIAEEVIGRELDLSPQMRRRENG